MCSFYGVGGESYTCFDKAHLPTEAQMKCRQQDAHELDA